MPLNAGIKRRGLANQRVLDDVEVPRLWTYWSVGRQSVCVKTRR